MMLSEAVDRDSIKGVSDNYWGAIIILNPSVMVKTRQGKACSSNLTMTYASIYFFHPLSYTGSLVLLL